MSWFQRLKQLFSGDRRTEPESDAKGSRDGGLPGSSSMNQAMALALVRNRALIDDSGDILPGAVDSASANWNQGLQCEREGDFEKALHHYSELFKLAPTFGHAYVNRGVCFRSLSDADYTSAVADFDRAVALMAAGVERAIAYANRAGTFESAGDLSAALADYSRAAKMGPQLSFTGEGLERVRAKVGAKSVEVECSPDEAKRRAEAFMAEGWQRSRRGDVVGALAAFQKAIEQSPLADAFYGRGVASC